MGRYIKGWSKDHQAVFKLYTHGVKPKDIVTELGFGIDKVRNIIAQTNFQEKHTAVIGHSVETARKYLSDKLVVAAAKIVQIMESGKPEERLKFDAAKEILYQCGMKPVEVVETRTRQYTPEELQSSLAVVKEIQTIEEKLAAAESKFVIKEKDEAVEVVEVEAEAPMCLPVTATLKANE